MLLLVTAFYDSDGMRLAYREDGHGDPLICLPGGPMQSAAYLGDLGGLSGHCSLVLLDLRGTGDSAVPADPATYRCDRQVAELRHGEAWFPDAFAAFERIWSGDATDADWTAITPFTSGRWDADIAARHARDERQQNRAAAAVYYSDGAIDTGAIRSALADLRAPVLLIAGEYDVALPPKCATEYAGLFPHAETAVQLGGGHYPWLDNPEWFTRTLAEFLLLPASSLVKAVVKPRR